MLYLISNIVIIGLLDKGRHRERVTQVYLCLFLYFFPCSVIAMALICTLVPLFSINISSDFFILFHGFIVLILVIKRMRKGEDMYQLKTLLLIFAIGTGIVLALPVLILILIVKYTGPKDKKRPPQADRAERNVKEQKHHPSTLDEPPIDINQEPQIKLYQMENKIASQVIDMPQEAPKVKDPNITCSICLEDFENQMNLRVLKKCKHVFHRACIDDWLNNGKDSCPLCRSSIQEEKS